MVVLETAVPCDAGELGPPDEFSARVDIEVDSPGPSRVIQSVALRARSGTARIHAPKDLQVRSCSRGSWTQLLVALYAVTLLSCFKGIVDLPY